MSRNKFTIHDILMQLVLVSPLAMLLQNRIDSINRLLVGGIIIGLMIATFLRKRLNRRSALALISTCIVFGYSLFNINYRYFSVNMLFYFPLWVLYLLYSVDFTKFMMESFKRNKIVARAVIWVWSILVLISFALPSSYTNGDFHSFAQGNFRFAPTVFFMGALIWAYSGMFEDKRYLIFMIVPFIAMIATGSRTYTVIMLIMFALAFYNYFENKKFFWILLMPAFFLVVDVLAGSQFVSKFQRVMGNKYVKDPLAAITSNRSVFWLGELHLFESAGILEKLLGGGLTSSFVKNVSISGQAIWAHNDFLEVLNAHGICGILIYFLCFFRAFKSYNKCYRYTLIQKLTFLSCLLLNAFFNGLYVYTTAMLSIPFFAYAVTIDFGKKLREGIVNDISC